jgi:hypothetical protein
VLTAARLLTSLHVVFVWGIIATLISLISLVALVYILAALLAGLIGAFVAAGVRHFVSPWRVNAFYARRVDGLNEGGRSCLILRVASLFFLYLFCRLGFSST